jgi:membrane protease YdiL (CAAX protease family)
VGVRSVWLWAARRRDASLTVAVVPQEADMSLVEDGLRTRSVPTSAKELGAEAMNARTAASDRRGVVARWVLALGALLLASAASVLIAVLNQPWFAFVNGLVGARETVARGLLFSSWLIVVGAPIVLWRPSTFGFQFGETRRHWRLVATTLIAAAGLTAVLLRAVGATPYSQASLFIESVVVPVTEELVFRGVLLTVLLVALSRLLDRRTALILAVAFDGIAFGLAHLANMTSLATAFVLAQATFAGVLGMGCAYLMARTRSIYPAIALHALVNAVVVVAS